uniref:Ovule protein n=1 Tax=Panagrellus redivivus TaxID=6233 RepID=A0A7E4VPA4_PANRE
MPMVSSGHVSPISGAPGAMLTNVGPERRQSFEPSNCPNPSPASLLHHHLSSETPKNAFIIAKSSKLSKIANKE